MNLSETEELGVFQAGNHAEDSLLIGELQVILKSHDVIARLHQIFLAKLDYSIRHTVGARINKPHGAHRSETERVATAACEFLDRQARLEVIRFFEVMNGDTLGGHHRVIKRVILLRVHRTVQIIV